MKELKNEIIRASAGTGKTHALVRRYLWLLAHDAEPERIAAMTFTRKAAGEFFERILQKLAEIAEHPERSRGYVDELTAAKSLELLRKMLRSMDRLRLGTIDSFFAAMAQSLPFELGLTGQAALMAEEEATQAREEVLDELLLAVTRMSDKASLDELRESWKDASHGSEQNKPAETLLKWIGGLHHLFVECPALERWGGESVIWPQGNEKIERAGLKLQDAAAVLDGALDRQSFQKRAVEKWEKFFEELQRRNDADKIAGTTVEYMLDEDRVKNDPGGFERLRAGGVKWMMWKDVVLDSKFGAVLADVLDAIIGKALRVRCRRTAAQFNVLRLYETIYHRQVRSRGRLVFGDLGWLLSGRLSTGGMSADEWRAKWDELRTALEFRMDARYDHWLLDEFQDTSERQWEVLAPLLEEARQDAEQRRSVLLVGDLKQSLYLWRQAEPELFRHVEKSWNDERLHLRPLNESHRSCPQVLEMVNAIFLKAEPDLETRFPGVTGLWKFDEHRCAEKVAKLKGHAAFLSLPDDDDADADAEVKALSALIRKIDPLSRRLTCAVLVRTNDKARELSDALRRTLGIEVICETAEAVITDNPATLALLSLFQLAAHPGDSLAWQHLLMTPLGDELRARKMSSAMLSVEVRGAVAAKGFLDVAREWAERLRAELAKDDAFTERRLAQFFEFAADFDESGSRDVDVFLRQAREYRVREDAASARAIQVMTIHQSKGLQFDMVVLPQLQGESIGSVTRNRLFVSRGNRGEVEWILDKPEAQVPMHDETLRDAQKKIVARQAFEGLCRLYVGVTRAKLGLYLLVAEGRNKTSNNEADLLRARLGSEERGSYDLDAAVCDCLWETGDRDWFTREEAKPASSAGTRLELPVLGELLRKVNRVITRRTPSGEESFSVKGVDLLSPGRDRGRLFGTLVHELFAVVDWFDGDEAALTRRWCDAGFSKSEWFDEAARAVLGVLRDRAIRSWFENGSGNREAWCERRFDMLLGSGWVSGALDRVVIERNEARAVTAATILDFKTDAVTDEASMAAKLDGYRGQLALYKEAVARLTGLRPVDIRAGLVFLQAGAVRWAGEG